jgi:hypothetical protein
MLSTSVQAASDGARACELDPSLPRGPARAAKALMVLGRFDEAEEVLRAALGQHPQLRQELVNVQIVARKVRSTCGAVAGWGRVVGTQMVGEWVGV